MIAKKQINIIGNNNDGKIISDGGRIKIRLFFDLLKSKGFDVNLIDLNNWKKHIFRTISVIKKAIKNDEDIIIMAGPNGCRLIIPIVYRFNRRHHSRVVFCPVGIGSIDKIVRKMTNEQVNDFLLANNFYGTVDNKIGRCLSSFQHVVLENEVLRNCYEKFYGLSNTCILTNFRVFDDSISLNRPITKKELSCVYFSRICENKGILDLITAVKRVNEKQGLHICVDIYGDIQFDDKKEFLELMDKNICYCGTIDQKESYSTLSKYDLFVLPTKYYGEGTSGALVESLIAGTPVLVSNYSQSKELVIENYNGFFFDLADLGSLEQKLKDIYLRKDQLLEMRENVKNSSKQFVYKNIEGDFLRYIGGVK